VLLFQGDREGKNLALIEIGETTHGGLNKI